MAVSYADLKALSRRMRIPLRQHHVIVHRDGRVYFRVEAGIPTQRAYYCQSISWARNAVFRLTFMPIPDKPVKRRLVPSRAGTNGMNFFDIDFAAKAVPPGCEHVRLRIVKRTRLGPQQQFRIWLSAHPVRDMLSIWQDMKRSDNS